MQAGERGEEAEELVGFAGVGEGQEDVAGEDGAEVAVESFNRVKEGGGGAGGVERGGDFACDDAGFADAGEDDVVAAGGACGEEGEGLLEGGLHGGVEALGEFVEGAGFEADILGGAGGGLWHAPSMLAERVWGDVTLAVDWESQDLERYGR